MQNVKLVGHKENAIKFNCLVSTIVIPNNSYYCRQRVTCLLTVKLTSISCQPSESGKECVARQIYSNKLQFLKGLINLLAFIDLHQTFLSPSKWVKWLVRDFKVFVFSLIWILNMLRFMDLICHWQHTSHTTFQTEALSHKKRCIHLVRREKRKRERGVRER